jgi:hypothetical protein
MMAAALQAGGGIEGMRRTSALGHAARTLEFLEISVGDYAAAREAFMAHQEPSGIGFRAESSRRRRSAGHRRDSPHPR